jgi:hypothetical protein
MRGFPLNLITSLIGNPLGSFVVVVILYLMFVGSQTPSPTSASIAPVTPTIDPFKTTAKIVEGCTTPGGAKDYAGVYTPKTNEIRLCTQEIDKQAAVRGLDPIALKRFILAHEIIHSQGELNETEADRIATDRLLAAGDREAVAAYGAVESNGSEYDAGRRYAQSKAQQN